MVSRLFRFIDQASNSQRSVDDKSKATANSQRKSKIEDTKGGTMSETQSKKSPTQKTVIIDSKTGEIVEEPPTKNNDQAQSIAQVEKMLPPNLPPDIIRLADQIKAFFQGILALQRLNLDKDLLYDAMIDLRKKYDEERDFRR